jgi:hypothetical protein
MAREIGRTGALLLLVLGAPACAGQAVPATLAPPLATATPATAHGSWAEALVLTGDVEGSMSGVVVGNDAARSECSGRNSRQAGAWASALFGPVGPEVYEVVVTVRPYRGPGLYRGPNVMVQVARQDGAAVWQTSGAAPAAFTVGTGEESGSVDATLTNLSNDTSRLRLIGRWNCVT